MEIPLTRGKVAIIDDADAAIVAGLDWYASPRRQPGSEGMFYYAITVRRAAKPDGTPTTRTRFMHRMILGARPGEFVDHVDGNGLNNRRSNLRMATLSQNQHNRRKHKIATSRHKGVCWHKWSGSWRAQIEGDHLGVFASEVEAALAYDEAARKRFGVFAYLNYPNAGERGYGTGAEATTIEPAGGHAPGVPGPAPTGPDECPGE